MSDLIERQAAIDAVLDSLPDDEYWNEQVKKAISALPSAQPEEVIPSTQPERDIPLKPKTIDTAWEIANRQAVCPKCDHYLGRAAVLGDYMVKRITYCEACGQAIDWEGWDFYG